jgi:hypothetical protein
MPEIDTFEKNKQPILPQAVLITAALLFVDSLPNLTGYPEDEKAAAAVVQVDPNYEEGKTVDINELELQALIAESDKDKGAIRDWTAVKVEKLVTGIYKIIEKIDIKTYDGRQRVIKQLRRFYNDRFPVWLKEGIEKTIINLKEIKRGTIDGFREADIKRQWRELFRIRPLKTKEDLKGNFESYVLTSEEIQAEFDRVTQATNAWAEPDQNLGNSTNGSQI